MQTQQQIEQQIIKFSENAGEELSRLYQELKLDQLLDAIKDGRIPSDLQEIIIPATATLLDIFGTDTPVIGMDPVETLKVASRDMNLSRIVRERGLFRLYRLLNTNDSTGPMWKGLRDPETNEPFNRREDLIGWFCHSAKVSRSIVFMRMGTIEKLTGLGFDLDDAYATILTKPSAIRETLNAVADWSKAELESVTPDTAVRLAQKYLRPADAAEVKELAAVVTDKTAKPEDRIDAQEKMTQRVAPAIVELVRDVATHDRVKDAMELVNIDIAGRPDIAYSWDYDRDELVCEVTIHGTDPKGLSFIERIFTIRLVSTDFMDPGLRADLIQRLPIKNRIRQED